VADSFLNPINCLLSEATPVIERGEYHASNKYPVDTTELFVTEYVNGDRGQTITQPEQTTSIAATPAFDEGGNFIDVRFGPITRTNPITGLPFSNYHLAGGVIGAIDGGTNSVLVVPLFVPGIAVDLDNQVRPNPASGITDIGADENY
jgi:hypothetical protein